MLTQTIFALHAAAYAFTAGRLVALGLARRQTSLLFFLSFSALFAVFTLVVPQSSPYYFWAYIALSPLNAPLSLLAVREALGLVLDEYKGLRSLGRWTMYGAVLVSLVASAVISAAVWRTDFHSNLYYVEVINRNMTFALGGVIASLLIFLSHYRLNISRNRFVSSVAFGLMVSADALTLYIDSGSEHLNAPTVDLANMAFGTVCMVVWGILLEREATESAQTPGPPRPGNEQRLQQLRNLDALITKVARKRGPGAGTGTPNLFQPPA